MSPHTLSAKIVGTSAGSRPPAAITSATPVADCTMSS
jgi:hypothetical protein